MNIKPIFEKFFGKIFFFRLLEVTYRDPKLGEQTRLVVHKPDAVAAILYDTRNQEFILVEQPRPAAFVREQLWSTLECPAGVNPDNEEAVEKMYQEIMEETQHELTSLKRICEVYPSVGTCTEKITMYAGTVLSNSVEETGVAEEGERLILHRVSLHQIENLIASGEMSDMKFVLGYYYMKAEGWL